MIMDLVHEYIGFATGGGTVMDSGTYLLLGGPIVIALLACYAAYNSIALGVNGVRRTVRAVGYLAGRVRPAGATAVATPAVVAGAVPAPSAVPAARATNTPTIAGAAYARTQERVHANIG